MLTILPARAEFSLRSNRIGDYMTFGRLGWRAARWDAQLRDVSVLDCHIAAVPSSVLLWNPNRRATGLHLTSMSLFTPVLSRRSNNPSSISPS